MFQQRKIDLIPLTLSIFKKKGPEFGILILFQPHLLKNLKLIILRGLSEPKSLGPYTSKTRLLSVLIITLKVLDYFFVAIHLPGPVLILALPLRVQGKKSSLLSLLMPLAVVTHGMSHVPGSLIV